MEERISPPMVEAARKGDAGALAAICEKLYPRIHRYLSWKVEDPKDAEDLAGEVFVRLLEGIPDQTGNLEAWLFRIAGNLLTDHYRRRAVRTETVGFPEEIAGGEDPAAATERKLSGERLKRSIKALTEEQKEVVILRIILGYEVGEVADMMGRSAGAVRALQFRALSVLRDALGAEI